MQFSVIWTLIFAAAFAAELPYKSKSSYTSVKSAYEDGPAIPFAFGYAIKDVPSYNDYSHDTKSDGKVRTGSYRTLLPDGRVQIVNYRADENGYVADVKYQGEAKYDSKPATYKPTYPTPAATPTSYAKPATYSKPSN